MNSRHSERNEESSVGRDSGKILRCAQNDRGVVLQTAKQLRKFLARGRFTFPQEQCRIALAPFEFNPRSAPGAERLWMRYVATPGVNQWQKLLTTGRWWSRSGCRSTRVGTKVRRSSLADFGRFGRRSATCTPPTGVSPRFATAASTSSSPTPPDCSRRGVGRLPRHRRRRAGGGPGRSHEVFRHSVPEGPRRAQSLSQSADHLRLRPRNRILSPR